MLPTRALVRALQVRLVEHDVSFGHWTFLRVLWEHDGLTQRELSREAGVMEPTTFTALQALERLGYVERRQLPGISSGRAGGIKRVKTVRAGWHLAMRATTGKTRAIQGVCHGVSSAKRFCMSMQRWTVRSLSGPKESASNVASFF